ncbi:hypothetical protein E8E13_001489 [Curvularia kusanoi]|uniref:RING-type domain-containing protein n=1 Tax=Curvularia kusanoi TaxID=90978 RepID=A0A9P4TB36_CURKU|nr:hypothetical protein E8E13_001489 [Curvularia kusanoi]
MRPISRVSWRNTIGPAMSEAWANAQTSGVSKNFLPEMYAEYSNSLPSPRDMGLVFTCFFEMFNSLPTVMFQGASWIEHGEAIGKLSRFLMNLRRKEGVNIVLPRDPSRQLNNLVVAAMEAFFIIEDVAWEEAQTRARLLGSNLPRVVRLGQLRDYTWGITWICFSALMDTFLPLFRSRWTNLQFLEFTRGFEQGLDSTAIKIVVPLLDPQRQPLDYYDDFFMPNVDLDAVEDDDLGFEFVPTGPRIPLDAFCQPTDSTGDEDCVICGHPVAVCEAGDEAVVTACKHYFHAECLASWVNDSAAENSGTCPYCRTDMCEARSRALVDDNAVEEQDRYEEAVALRGYIHQWRDFTAPVQSPGFRRGVSKRPVEREDFL